MNYKKSRFIFTSNYLKDFTIYYQSITDSFLIIKKKDSHIFNHVLSDTNKYSKAYSNLISLLYLKCFIVEAEKNEIEDLKTRNRLSIFSDNHYMLTINPTLNCNLSCWYCDQHTIEKTKITSQTLNLIKKHITWIAKNGSISGIHLDWFGGEPLLQFYDVMVPIAKHTINQSEILNLKFTHHVTTNAVLITKEMCQVFKDIELNSFQITVDGYNKKHNSVKNINGKPTYSTVIRNINLILETISNCNINLRINYDDDTLDDIKPLFDEFPANNRKSIQIDFQKIWQKRNESKKHNEKLQELLLYCTNLGYDARVAFFENKQPYRACYADKFYHTVINYNGKVYNAQPTIIMMKKDI